MFPGAVHVPEAKRQAGGEGGAARGFGGRALRLPPRRTVAHEHHHQPGSELRRVEQHQPPPAHRAVRHEASGREGRRVPSLHLHHA